MRERMATMPLNRQAGRLVEAAFAGFLRDALAQYRLEVEASDLQRSTKHDYQRHAENFVRWLEGTWKPGHTAE